MIIEIDRLSINRGSFVIYNLEFSTGVKLKVLPCFSIRFESVDKLGFSKCHHLTLHKNLLKKKWKLQGEIGDRRINKDIDVKSHLDILDMIEPILEEYHKRKK